jgi:hypothetical protein
MHTSVEDMNGFSFFKFVTHRLRHFKNKAINFFSKISIWLFVDFSPSLKH